MLGWREKFKSKKLFEKEELIKLRQEGRKFKWGNRELGELSLDKKRFITHRKKGHFYKKQKSFNINAELINKYLIPINVEKVIIYYHKKNGGETCYVISPKRIKEIGILSKEGFFDLQYALPVKDLYKYL